MMRGTFITFEGGEGSGKSTQARLLVDALNSKPGVFDQVCSKAIASREPGGTPRAEAIRSVLLDPSLETSDPLTDTLLFYAARADHLTHLIEPALSDGTWVVCDRFSDSTRAYQGAAGGMSPERLATLEAMVVGKNSPDLTFLLDLPAGEGLQRARARQVDADPASATDPFEAQTLAFHEKLRDGFLALAKVEPERIVVLDATREITALHDDIVAAVLARLVEVPAT